MAGDKLSMVLRILDNENRLLERADQKAIALLSTLGVFMVFFVVYFRVMPINAVTVTLNSIYFFFALLSIISLILTVRPRIRSIDEDTSDEDSVPASEPAFFMGIRRFRNLSAYKEVLDVMAKDEETTANVYIRQIYSLAQINAVKYKYIQRAVLLVIISLTVELITIAYLFASHFSEGHIPSITGM
jgi:hypothetical protein